MGATWELNVRSQYKGTVHIKLYPEIHLLRHEARSVTLLKYRTVTVPTAAIHVGMLRFSSKLS